MKLLGKTVFALLVLILCAVLTDKVPVSADEGKTVRVSTAKELKNAMSSEDADTIIFRTSAYLKLTIKALDNAEDKNLIIDAPNVNITNKAKFSSIKILKAKDYVEKASGNTVIIADTDCRFSLYKKKTLEKFIVYNPGTYIDLMNYRVGYKAKINELEFVYTGCEEPQSSTFDAGKRKVIFDYTDEYGLDHYFIYKLDKRGRIIKIVDTHPEFGGTYTVSYNPAGNPVSAAGEDARGYVENTYLYDEKNRIKTYQEKADDYFASIDYKYEDSGLISSMEFSDSELGNGYCYMIFGEDRKGRTLNAFITNSEGFNEVDYTYDKKSFLKSMTITKTVGEEKEQVLEQTFEYNKAGDLIKDTVKDENGISVTEYSYDSLGELLGKTVNGEPEEL